MVYAEACATSQEMLYITERTVFRLVPVKPGDCPLELIEIASGVDLERDVLGKMEFKPRIADNLKVMDSWIFEE